MSYTSLVVVNKSNQSAPVTVFLTLGAQANNVSFKDFPFIKENGTNPLQGTFSLKEGASQTFAPQQFFSGNIGFYITPQCPTGNPGFSEGKEGTSIAEFTLNTPDETFDISCVNGMNCYIEMSVDKDGWVYGQDSTPIKSIKNKALYQNTGNPGVYPVGCTTCTGNENSPCNELKSATPQPEPICNISRSESAGGTLTITLLPNPSA